MRERRLSDFGAGSHGFELGPPLSEEEVRAFEIEQGVTLPDAYRAFITQVGHGGPGAYGGAGPYYGLYELNQWADIGEWICDELPAGWLALPSPLIAGPNELPPLPDDDDDDDENWPGDEVVGAYHGILALGSRGCTYSTGLVVTGEARGHVVYTDADHHEPPYVGRDADFLCWYERWLDEMLAGFKSSWFGYGPAGEEATLLRIIEETSDDVLRSEALGNLSKLPERSDAIWRIVAPLAASLDAAVRVKVAWLMRYAPDRLLPAIDLLLYDASPRVRINAIYSAMTAAADLYGEKVWNLLLEDADSDVRSTAYHSLKDANALDETRLLALVTEPRFGRLRASAVPEIEWRPEHAELVTGLLADEEARIRQAAVGALEKVDSPRAIAVAVTQLAKEENESTQTSFLVMLAKVGAVEAAPAMLEIAENGNDFQRLNAVKALANLGDERLIPIATEMLTMDREPTAPGRGHSFTIAELVKKSLLESPNASLRALADD